MNFCGECGRRTRQLTHSEVLDYPDTVCVGCWQKPGECTCTPVDWERLTPGPQAAKGVPILLGSTDNSDLP
jgi:hypothetical protein